MTTPTTVQLDAKLKTASIRLILEAATTNHEILAVTRVALRAGFLWRCWTCRSDYHLTTKQCRCGTPRPEGLA